MEDTRKPLESLLRKVIGEDAISVAPEPQF